MRILGIDPGYERLGIAVLDPVARERRGGKNYEHVVLYSECFKTDAKLPFNERLLLLGKKIKEVIKMHQPDVLAIETLFLNTNQKTAMHVAEVRGVIIYESISANLRIFEASPPQIKLAVTGHGGASKEQINKMVKMLVDIDKNKKSDDELDAVAIALTASAHIRA